MLGTVLFGTTLLGAESPTAQQSGLECVIDGIKRDGMLVHASLKVSDNLESKKTAAFTLHDSTGTYKPTRGESVLIRWNGHRKFFGKIYSASRRNPYGPLTADRWIDVKCVNYSHNADRRLVATAYENYTLAQIVADVVANHLADGGIQVGVIETGPTFTRVVYNYMKASAVFDELARFSGYSWWVDDYKRLHFRSRNSTPAPFALTDASKPYRNLSVYEGLDEYRNRQWLRAGKDQTDLRTENYLGDGTQKNLTLDFPAATEPAIEVDGSPVTVGIRGLESGKDWYWQKGDNVLTQDDDAAAVGNGLSIEVTYRGFFPIMAYSESATAIAERASAETDDGYYDAIEADESIEDKNLAFDKAESIIRKKAELQDRVEYETFREGLAAGQLQDINVTEESLAGNFLLENIEGVYSVDEGRWIDRVEAVSGESFGGWREFFKALFQSGQKYTIRENEVILSGRRMVDQIDLTDSVDFATAATDRSDDPYTTSLVSDDTQDDEFKFRVGKARVGRANYS